MKPYVVTKHMGPPPCMLFPTDDEGDDGVDDNVDDTDTDNTIILIIIIA